MGGRNSVLLRAPFCSSSGHTQVEQFLTIGDVTFELSVLQPGT